MAIGPRGEIYFTSGRTDDGKEDEGADTLWMLPPVGEPRAVLRRAGGIDQVVALDDRLLIVAGQLPHATDEDAHADVMTKRREAGVSAILYDTFPVRSWDTDLGPAVPRLFSAPLPALDGDDMLKLEAWPTPPGRLDTVVADPAGHHVLAGVSLNDGAGYEWGGVFEMFPDREPQSLAVPTREDADSDTRAAHVGVFAINQQGTKALLGAFNGNRPGKPARAWMEQVDLETGQISRFGASLDDWVSDACYVDEHTVVASAPRRGRESVYRIEGEDVRLLTDDDWAYHHLAAWDERHVVCLRSSITCPPLPVLVDVTDGTVTPLASPVTPVAQNAQVSEVQATALDGTPLRSWLLTPTTEHPEGGFPLLTFVHGGPWGTWNDWTWRWNPGPFVAAGYAVLLPDPAISTGYGQAMIDRGNNAIGDTPYTDILQLIAATEARDDIDACHTALLGGSYGGYMANWMAGHTGAKCRCIVAHASLWNIDLMGGPRRFSELKQSIGGISAKVLTANLRAMEADHLLTRQAYAEIPPRVEYALTDTGTSLAPVVESLAAWGSAYKQALATA